MSVTFLANGAVEDTGKGVINYRRYGEIYYHQETPDEVVRVLHNAHVSRWHVRIHYGSTKLGDEKYGVDWLEEHDVVGRIGSSTGKLKIPLIVKKGDDGGFALLDHCIVKISHGKKLLYKHPYYKLPEITVRELLPNEEHADKYSFVMLVDGSVHARFKTLKQATKLKDFLIGVV